ncbi:MAG: hypothetical protein Q7S52_05825 [bacterium]|nr:hypothetical protein [bacterium]
MKFFKQLLALIVLLTPLAGSPVFAATYPATCPAEAQGIVDAVGGCAAISPTDYAAIYGKCCSEDTMPTTPEMPVSHADPNVANWIGVVILAGLVCGAWVGIRALIKSKQKSV